VREQDLEAPLLLAHVRRLIGPELINQAVFIQVGGGRERRVLNSIVHAIVPARVLRHVIGRGFDCYRTHAAAFHHFLQQRAVVFQEEIQEFLLVSPLHLGSSAT
jgi:hypothetical protein